MPSTEIFCGSVARTAPSTDGEERRIILYGPGKNAVLNVDNLWKSLVQTIPDELHDLLEIATYIYVADQWTSRGPRDGSDFGRLWRRQLHFTIPVRRVETWKRPEVRDALIEAVGFLSDDCYTFTFVSDPSPAHYQEYIDFGEQPPSGAIDEVTLFSGGLDSLAGAMEGILAHRQRLLLVTHVPTDKFEYWHKPLRGLMAHKAGQDLVPHFVRIHANKEGIETVDYTQRSRSFLYASMAFTIARMLGKDRLRFFENGVTSLNLPINDQLLGARATRTTHPETLRRFGTLFTALAGRPFRVENAYQWLTKTEVVQKLLSLGCQGMIEFATSCAHTWQMSKEVSHCGGCSQCVDRRFAILAARAADFDPAKHYRKDLWRAPREERDNDKERTLIGSFAMKARAWSRMNESELFFAEGDIGQALAALPGPAAENARRLVGLLHRHATAVTTAIDYGVAEHYQDLARNVIPADAFLYMVVEREHGEPDPAMPPRPATVAPPAPRFPNWFRHVDDGWLVMLGGNGPHRLDDCLGAHLLHLLLGHPERRYAMPELGTHLRGHSAHLLNKRDLKAFERQLTAAATETDDDNHAVTDGDGHDGLNGFGGERGIEVIDQNSVRLLQAEIRTTSARLKRCPATERAALEQRLQGLRDLLSDGTVPGKPGRVKRVNPALDRLQRALMRNIDTVVQKLGGIDPVFTRFFARVEAGGCLSLELHHLRYIPPAGGCEWELRPSSMRELISQRQMI